METRRKFIKTAGSVAAASLISPHFASAIQPPEKKKVIGIIGAENSHTAGFGKIFNIEKHFPDFEVKYVWGETDAFAKIAMEKGQIPYQVKDQKEMLGNIDALIVDHRHAKYHLEAAWPFVEAGIPTFIDKPFCYRAAQGKEFLEMAHQNNTPVSSFSSIAQSAGTFDMNKQVEEMTELRQVVRTGTVDLDSKYGGVFFYGVHVIQPLLFAVGDDVEQVKISRNGSCGNAALRFSSGLFATLIFKEKAYGWETFVENKEGFQELKSRVEEPTPGKNYTDMVEMFRTGKVPRSYQSILNCVSVLEALEKSAKTEKWTDVEFQKLRL
jgi:predicted dehydrogenase